MELNLIQKLNYYNPWWQTESFEIGIKREKYLKQITPLLKGREALALIGVRRSGKTFLMLQTIDALLKTQDKENIIFLQADDDLISSQIKDQGLLYIIQEYLNYRKKDFSQRLYVFVDEIQEIKNWETELKNLFDLNKNIKLIVSGSSAAKLKSKAIKKLVGRIMFLEVSPLSFNEFVFFKNNLKLIDDYGFSEIKKSVQAKLNQQHIFKRNFLEYLKFGGYPRVVLEEDKLVKERLLRDYLDLILKRDIASFFSIEDLEIFEGVLKFLAKNTSGKISFFRIAKDTGIKIDTVKKYYYYLQQSFMVFNADFYKTTYQKIRRPKKFYFTDLGVRNLLSGNLGIEFSATELGFLVENFVAQKLQQDGNNIEYFEDKQKNEVDFIIKKKNQLIPLEVKFKNKIDKKDLKGILAFLKREDVRQAIVVTKNLYQEEKIDKKDLLFVPAYYL